MAPLVVVTLMPWRRSPFANTRGAKEKPMETVLLLRDDRFYSAAWWGALLGVLKVSMGGPTMNIDLKERRERKHQSPTTRGTKYTGSYLVYMAGIKHGTDLLWSIPLGVLKRFCAAINNYQHNLHYKSED